MGGGESERRGGGSGKGVLGMRTKESIKGYKFEPVAGPRFAYTCVGCEKRKDSRDGVWADLNGEAWKDYYCKPCKQARTEEKGKTCSH